MTHRATRFLHGSILAVSAGLVVLTVVSTPLDAQTRRQACAMRDDVVSHLDAKFGEHRSSLMLDAQGNLLEMFSNHETGSWTLTVTLPGGPTCVMNSGEHFFQEAQTASVEEQAS